MELRKVTTGVTRRVFPIKGDDSVWVDMKRLSDAELNRIYDNIKYVPGSKHATMAKASTVVRQLIDQQILGWGGFTYKGADVPCTPENKLRLLETEISSEDGETESVWAACNRKFAELEEADEKN